MNSNQFDDSYGHRVDTQDIPRPEYETVSGPVYINQGMRSNSMPEVDEIYLSSGDEHIGEYPEGAYQTWSARQQDQFGVEDAVDAVKHFFSEAAEVVTTSEEAVIDDNVGYHTKDGSGW